MHYDNRAPKQIKLPQEIISALDTHPLTRETAIKMILDGARVNFIKMGEGKGFALPSMSSDGGKMMWDIYVDYSLPDQEKEEIIWHELVHLHLRRLFNCPIIDDRPGIHPLIVQEGERLTKIKPLGYKELLFLLGIYRLNPF